MAGRIRPLMGAHGAVVEMRMFGGIAFLVNGNMAVAASGQGGLMLRCLPENTDALVAEPGVDRVVMRGRAMDGWIRVDEGAVTTEAALRRWIEVGAAFAKSLPPKV